MHREGDGKERSGNIPWRLLKRKSMWTGFPPSVDRALESSSGGVLGPGDGGDDSREELDEESEWGETTISSSGYVVYDGGGSLEVEKWS